MQGSQAESRMSGQEAACLYMLVCVLCVCGLLKCVCCEEEERRRGEERETTRRNGRTDDDELSTSSLLLLVSSFMRFMHPLLTHFHPRIHHTGRATPSRVAGETASVISHLHLFPFHARHQQQQHPTSSIDPSHDPACRSNPIIAKAPAKNSDQASHSLPSFHQTPTHPKPPLPHTYPVLHS